MPDTERRLIVPIYFFPYYVNLHSVQFSSPKLIDFLRGQGAQFQEEHWQGTLNSVPVSPPPVLIRASSIMMECGADELAKLCVQRGHLLFYDDQLILESGEYTKAGLIEAAGRFLANLTK